MVQMRGTGDLLFYRFGGRTESLQRSVMANVLIDDVESVIEEVKLLLNTRSPLSASACAALSRRSVVDYGLADFLHFSPLSRQDAQQLSLLIRQTIIAHEPRLKVDSVTVETPRPYRDRVHVIVSGHVRKRNNAMVAVCFSVHIVVTTLKS